MSQIKSSVNSLSTTMGFFLESSATEVLLGLITLLTLFYYWTTSTYDYWKKQGVPGAPTVPFFGNTLNSLLNRYPQNQLQLSLYKYFENGPFGGFYTFREPQLWIRDPQLIEAVLIKDFSHFYNRGTFFDENLDPLSAHLVNLRDKRWKGLRNKLTPVFSSGKLKLMHEHLADCAQVLVEYLKPFSASNEPIEARNVMGNFSTDVIGNVAFGLEMNAINDPNSQFRKLGKEIFRATKLSRLRQILSFVYPKVILFLKWKNFSTEGETFFIDSLRETIRQRKEKNVQRNDFLQLLINLRESEKNKEATDPEDVVLTETLLLANCLVFFAAGFETTAATLSYCLFELAHNPDIQESLYQKLVEEIGDKANATYDNLKKVTYLDQVIKETLRKYPPILVTARVCNKPYQLPVYNIPVPEGQRIIIPIYSIHHDSAYYPSPEKFDPDRFHPDNTSSLVKHTWLPFGDGPRVCIGERFAIAELKVALALLLLNYEFAPSSRTSYLFEFDNKARFLVPKNGLWINIQNRIE